MHVISKVKIQNYKSIIDHEFVLSDYTPLVGYNNAGKTNILQAVSWLIKKYSLKHNEYHDVEHPVVVTAELSGITEEVLGALGDQHRERIRPFLQNQKINIRRTQHQPGVPATQIRLEISTTDPEGQETWHLNPAGIDAAIAYLFPEPVFVGAMDDVAEDVGKFGTSTTIGKLIGEITRPITEANAGPVAEALGEVARRLASDGQEKDENLVRIDGLIQAQLGRLFPGVSAKTHIPIPAFSEFLKGATIRIYDVGHPAAGGRDATAFGHGAQRAVQIALIKCLSELRRANAGGRTTLLLLDEPELYLHPQAVELIRASLVRLSSEGYQVLFTTHSPAMISRRDAHKVLLVRRSVERGTHAYPRIEDAVALAIDSADHQAEILFALTNSSKVLFAERVVLAEGKTERALLPDIFHHRMNATLSEERIALVDLGGVDNVPNAMNVLAAMGMSVRAVVDLDFVFRGAIASQLVRHDHDAIVGCKAILQRLADAGQIGLNADGLPRSANGVSASQAFALMASQQEAQAHLQNLHDSLLLRGVWFWMKGSIETHLGLHSKNANAHRAFLDSFQDEEFQRELPDYTSVCSMLDWLRAGG